MKKNLLLLAAVVLGMGLADVSKAQSNLTAISYEVSFPMSDTKDLINSTSFIGFMFDTRRFVQPNATIGLSVGLHVFDDKVDDEVINLGDIFENERNIDVWGTQYRYINSWPIMVNAFYYLGDRRSQIRPYLGSGFGVFAARRRLDMGLTSLAETKWQFGFTPEVGFLYDMGEVDFLVKANYNYGLKTGDVKALSYFKVGIGFAWTGY
jgi:outer membrane protein W